MAIIEQLQQVFVVERVLKLGLQRCFFADSAAISGHDVLPNQQSSSFPSSNLLRGIF